MRAPCRPAAPAPSAGFTLVEVLVSLALVALVLGLLAIAAAPVLEAFEADPAAADAALMGRSEMAVRALTHRGLHRLAELVGERPSPGSGNPGDGVTPAGSAAMERSR